MLYHAVDDIGWDLQGVKDDDFWAYTKYAEHNYDLNRKQTYAIMKLYRKYEDEDIYSLDETTVIKEVSQLLTLDIPVDTLTKITSKTVLQKNPFRRRK
jgi:hypothetical protein